MENVQSNALQMFKKKNKDYGDAFAKFGVIGVLMRIEDKIQRSLSITKNGVNMVDDESIRDTLMDLHNYAAMGIMLLDEKNKIEPTVVKQDEHGNYLKSCNKCGAYDYINYVNVCCMCKDFYCETCSKEMKYHGYYDETDRKYCNPCGKKYFAYHYS